ncbi:MAG: riboflavin kinase [Candidatus Paceibacterota bacterium]|jgi:riboflavin kinase/FMN adenylyltransferase
MQYEIFGKVIKGDQYGRKIGFPTVNLETQAKELPPAGVYAGEVFLDNVVYRAGIAIDSNNKIDAHLIGYHGDAYGKEVKLTLNKFLREYKNFNTEEELINQIKKDINLC